jgi:threonine synthase
MLAMGAGVMERYRDFLPITEATPLVTLQEGSTPLIPSRAIGRTLGLERLYFKYEGANPTGSFKDRGMAMAVARALQDRAHTIICASTGNTSAAASAYAARYGLRALVVVPAGGVALGKLGQALAHGAVVVAVRATFDQALDVVRELSQRPGVALVNSVNPIRIDGQKTAAFELCDELGDAPARLFLPVGNAGNITAYWRGFDAYRAAGRTTRLPVLHGAQAAGAAPLVSGRPVKRPRTVASALRIGRPAAWNTALTARDASGGTIEAVTDSEILAAQARLAREEGVLTEPAGAAGVALLQRRAAAHQVQPSDVIVCVLTGSGLKDPRALLGKAARPAAVAATPEAVARAAGMG